MMHKTKLFILCYLATSFCSHAGDRRFPMPERFAKSVVVGKTIRNPFVGKLRLARAKVDEFMLGQVAPVPEVNLATLVGTIVFYHDQSNRNRAVLDGRVRRPGDRFSLKDSTSARIIEIRRNSVVLDIEHGSTTERLEMAQKPMKAAVMK